VDDALWTRLARPVQTVRFSTLLGATAVGVYLLIVLGATTSIARATQACKSWPSCHGQYLAIDSASLAIVWGHRLTALVVGLLMVVLTARAWLDEQVRPRVRVILLVVLGLYPIQIAVGAVAATTALLPVVSTVHLLLAMGIFAGLVLALAWSLERQTAAEGSQPASTGGPPTPRETGPSSDAPVAPEGALDTARAYFTLMKPRLMWLLCLVASAGMALAAGPSLTLETAGYTLLGGVLSIGASGTFNNVLERDVDRKMDRTADRPVAQSTVPVRNAFAFGCALGAASVVVFLQVNLLAAALGLAAILYYSVIYTLVLKPNTVQNTVLGGLAGSLPALIGWAAVTNTIGVGGLALAGVIFCWTPAHFYNLALAYRDDYARGGFPMLPVVRGDAVTRKHILYYLGATLLAAAVLTATTQLGALYAVTVVSFGALFLFAAIRLHYLQTESAALHAFHASNAFLGAMLLAVVLDTLLV